MANMYRVNYTTTHKQNGSALVSATTEANAVTAAKANDVKFKDVVSIQQVSASHVVGS